MIIIPTDKAYSSKEDHCRRGLRAGFYTYEGHWGRPTAYLIKKEKQMLFKKGDIVQIVKETHPWFPCLLIVDEVKGWGVQAYIMIPKSNDGSQPVATAYNRVENEDLEHVGFASIVSA